MERTIETMRVEFLDLMRKLHRAGPPWMPDCEGLTPNQARALHLLYVMESTAGGEGARPGSLAHHLAVSPSALSQVAKVLEERGLVTRGRGEGDFRAVSMRLTPAGVEVGRALDDAFIARMRRLVDYVGPELFTQMMDGVAKVVEFRVAEGAADHAPGASLRCPCVALADEPVPAPAPAAGENPASEPAPVASDAPVSESAASSEPKPASAPGATASNAPAAAPHDGSAPAPTPAAAPLCEPALAPRGSGAAGGEEAPCTC